MAKSDRQGVAVVIKADAFANDQDRVALLDTLMGPFGAYCILDLSAPTAAGAHPAVARAQALFFDHSECTGDAFLSYCDDSCAAKAGSLATPLLVKNQVTKKIWVHEDLVIPGQRLPAARLGVCRLD